MSQRQMPGEEGKDERAREKAGEAHSRSPFKQRIELSRERHCGFPTYLAPKRTTLSYRQATPDSQILSFPAHPRRVHEIGKDNGSDKNQIRLVWYTKYFGIAIAHICFISGLGVPQNLASANYPAIRPDSRRVSSNIH